MHNKIGHSLLRTGLLLLLLGLAASCSDDGSSLQPDGLGFSDGYQGDASAPLPDTLSPYPADPFAGLHKVNTKPDIYWGSGSFGDTKGQLILWAPPAYTPHKAWPLVVYLHGGGKTTDNKQSQVQALGELKGLVSRTYPTSEVPKMNDFFLKQQNASPTDWKQTRAAVDSFLN